MPGAPAVVLGAINVAGHVLPVLNIRQRFSLPQRQIDPADQFLIARTARHTVALVIDEALGVIDHARRSSHYSSDEIASLAFEGPPPDPADLSRRWSATLETALSLIAKLPAERAGEAVFHAGRLGGALPQITG